MMLADFNALCEEDEIIITGMASSPPKRYVELRGMIATISRKEPLAVKVWPTPEIDGGKIWFEIDGIESVTKLE